MSFPSEHDRQMQEIERLLVCAKVVLGFACVVLAAAVVVVIVRLTA